MNDELRGLLLAALVLGVCAAGVAWWLEQFQEQRMMDNLHRELRTYLTRWDEFEQWLRAQEN